MYPNKNKSKETKQTFLYSSSFAICLPEKSSEFVLVPLSFLKLFLVMEDTKKLTTKKIILIKLAYFSFPNYR
ncbi:hypothetical protein EGQ50_00895 [Coxiella endosymbiont of Amblyomma sculptum]|nr:hypothetical protein EGQ50_00895 [Coxiella endosymbiont of Amblyomma sculptum]